MFYLALEFGIPIVNLALWFKGAVIRVSTIIFYNKYYCINVFDQVGLLCFESFVKIRLVRIVVVKQTRKLFKLPS